MSDFNVATAMEAYHEINNIKFFYTNCVVLERVVCLLFLSFTISISGSA